MAPWRVIPAGWWGWCPGNETRASELAIGRGYKVVPWLDNVADGRNGTPDGSARRSPNPAHQILVLLALEPNSQ